MVNRKSTNLVALVVAFAALGYLFFSLYPLPPKFNLKPHTALGEVMGMEAVKRLGPSGRLILIARDGSIDRNPVPAAQVRALTKAVTAAGAVVAATNWLMMDPIRQVDVPSGDFLQILLRTSAADVVVSFLGPPALTPTHWQKLRELREKSAAVIALCPGVMPRRVNLKAVMQANLLQVAVLSQPSARADPPATDTTQAWFDHRFILVTDPADARLSPPPSAAPGKR